MSTPAAAVAGLAAMAVLCLHRQHTNNRTPNLLGFKDAREGGFGGHAARGSSMPSRHWLVYILMHNAGTRTFAMHAC